VAGRAQGTPAPLPVEKRLFIEILAGLDAWSGDGERRLGHRAPRLFRYGRPGEWEAICLTFDIAVQGSSEEEVQRSLREAIALFAQSARDERDPKLRHKLLHRRAPLRVWLRYVSSFFLHVVFSRRLFRSRLRDAVPRLKCTFGQFVEIIVKNGFSLHRQSGTSHAIYRCEQGGEVRSVVVAAHN
jgi:predicted RNA binding protein YcfA (HicA-like mRNA interferase family)